MSFPLLTHVNTSRIEIAKSFFSKLSKPHWNYKEVFLLYLPTLPCQKHRIKMTFYIIIHEYYNNWLLSINMVNNIEADNDTTSEKL